MVVVIDDFDSGIVDVFVFIFFPMLCCGCQSRVVVVTVVVVVVVVVVVAVVVAVADGRDGCGGCFVCIFG